MLRHLGDVESDLSAIHRIDDIWDMEAGRFFRLAYRLPAYQGAIRMRAEAQAMQQQGGQRAVGGGAVTAPQRPADRKNVIDVGHGELGKIDGLSELTGEGLLSIERATD